MKGKRYNLKFKFIKILTVNLLLCIFAVNSAAQQQEYFFEKTFGGESLCEYSGIEGIPDISGYSAYVYNPETGSVIYRKNQEDIVYPASTVKLMTAIVAYENIPDLSTEITATKTAVRATKGSNMALKIGEQLTAEQLLYGLLVTGANDAANLLAEHVAGSVDKFCEMMNDKAKEIGANDTFYVNPTGLHDDRMKTTARDTAIIAKYFYYINQLFEMSDTTRYTIPETEYTQQRILLNRNLLISRVRSEKYYYSPAMGMSLGNTPEAGECIVSSCSDESGMTYICVVMNSRNESEENAACADAVALMKMCLGNFTYSRVLSPKNIICEIPVKLAVDTDYVTLLPENELKALLPKNLDYAKDITIEPRVSEDYAIAPIFEGVKYGEAVVKYKNEISIGTVSLVAGKSVDKSNVLYFIDRAEQLILGRWFRVFAICSIVLLLAYFAASVAFVSKRRKRRR